MRRASSNPFLLFFICALLVAASYFPAWSEAAAPEAEELGPAETTERSTSEQGNALDSKDPTIGKVTPLHKAVRSGRIQEVQTLLDHGAQVNAAIARRTIRWHRLETPLETAIRQHQPEIAKLLVERGSNVNAQTSNGETLLHLAARMNLPDLVRILLEGGAQATRRSRAGLTANHLAQKLDGKSSKRKEVISLLKEAEAKALQDEPLTVPVAPPSAPLE